jgi:hypothetical protein
LIFSLSDFFFLGRIVKPVRPSGFHLVEGNKLPSIFPHSLLRMTRLHSVLIFET